MTLYQIVKPIVRLALRLFCRRLVFAADTEAEGPCILACNHPNSFLDALIVATHYKKPVHFLARGDAFARPRVARLLRRLNLIPVYRLSEGRSLLKQNEDSFEECLQVLQNGGTVLIFSEGICRNEEGLRSLKKGTARLAYRAWHEKNIRELCVRPLSLSYASFCRVPAAVQVVEGTAICSKDVLATEPAAFYQKFNHRLAKELKRNLVVSHKKEEPAAVLHNSLLAVPAAIGWLAHKPYYAAIEKMARRKTAGTVFYHSVLFGLLLLTYPLFLLLVVTTVFLFTKSALAWLVVLVLPLLAYCRARA